MQLWQAIYFTLFIWIQYIKLLFLHCLQETAVYICMESMSIFNSWNYKISQHVIPTDILVHRKYNVITSDMTQCCYSPHSYFAVFSSLISNFFFFFLMFDRTKFYISPFTLMAISISYQRHSILVLPLVYKNVSMCNLQDQSYSL